MLELDRCEVQTILRSLQNMAALARPTVDYICKCS